MRCGALLTVGLMLSCAGCTTMISTPLYREPQGSFYQVDEHPYKGVPMAMKVPTHLDVWIEETYYLQRTPRGLEEFIPDHRNLDIRTEAVMTKKVFTVDFKRPASGSLTYELGFSDDQYLNKIANKIEDNTIRDVTAAVQRVAGAFASPTAAKYGGSLKNKIIEGTRTVAYCRFDIDEPDFDQQLTAFVHQHMNACHDCEGQKSPLVPEEIAVPSLGLRRLPPVAPDQGGSRAVQVARSAPAPHGTSDEHRSRPIYEDQYVTVFRQ